VTAKVTRPRKKKGRDVNGVLLLDKPPGITSNDVLQRVKRLFNANKAGHTGSLDKPATGMLPICFGEATKFTSFLLNADKYYYTCCQLGIETSTGDAEGQVTESHDIPALSEKRLSRVLAEFEGEILQVPPMHSALKHQGQRLYKLAYQGIEVDRKARPLTIYSIKLIGFTADQLELEIHCSKGTYIRKLVEDIGRRIGCGAHICKLVRTGVNNFSSEQMLSIDKLMKLSDTGQSSLDDVLLPIDSIIMEMPEVTLAYSISRYIENGQAVIVPHAPTAGMLRIYNQNHDFLGVGEVLEDGRIAPRRLVNLTAG
jgi:tRNA pseudouridine55 synthase